MSSEHPSQDKKEEEVTDVDKHVEQESQVDPAPFLSPQTQQLSEGGATPADDTEYRPDPSESLQQRKPGRKKKSVIERCQICDIDLVRQRPYYQRYKICRNCAAMDSIVRDGMVQRFCQQCGRFQDINLFDGKMRTCRQRLDRHAARRRRNNSMMLSRDTTATTTTHAVAMNNKTMNDDDFSGLATNIHQQYAPMDSMVSSRHAWASQSLMQLKKEPGTGGGGGATGGIVDGVYGGYGDVGEKERMNTMLHDGILQQQRAASLAGGVHAPYHLPGHMHQQLASATTMNNTTTANTIAAAAAVPPSMHQFASTNPYQQQPQQVHHSYGIGGTNTTTNNTAATIAHDVQSMHHLNSHSTYGQLPTRNNPPPFNHMSSMPYNSNTANTPGDTNSNVNPRLFSWIQSNNVSHVHHPHAVRWPSDGYDAHQYHSSAFQPSVNDVNEMRRRLDAIVVQVQNSSHAMQSQYYGGGDVHGNMQPQTMDGGGGGGGAHYHQQQQ